MSIATGGDESCRENEKGISGNHSLNVAVCDHLLSWIKWGTRKSSIQKHFYLFDFLYRHIVTRSPFALVQTYQVARFLAFTTLCLAPIFDLLDFACMSDLKKTWRSPVSSTLKMKGTSQSFIFFYSASISAKTAAAATLSALPLRRRIHQSSHLKNLTIEPFGAVNFWSFPGVTEIVYAVSEVDLCRMRAFCWNARNLYGILFARQGKSQ